MSGVVNIRLFTKAKCVFHGDKFLHDGKILSVIRLLPGGSLSTEKYGTVWCGGERDSELLLLVSSSILNYLLPFFTGLLSTMSLPMGGEYFLLPVDTRPGHAT